MDVTDIKPQLNELSASVDDLEAALKPLIDDLGSVSSKLPLLDKAKLNVLTCYAIESLLFSSLRLNGVEVTKDHAIFTELTRIKQYFAKIQKIETPPAERENTVNTSAAIRFIRNDLADNKEIKDKLTEQLIKEGAKAAELQEKKAEKKRLAEDESASQSETTIEAKSKNSKRTRSKR